MIFASKSQVYEPLGKDIADESLKQSTEEQSYRGYRQESRCPRCSRYNKILLTINLLLAAVLGLTAFMVAPHAPSKLTGNDLARLSSSYSPILDKVNLSLHPAAINDIHVPGHPEEIYPQQPGPEAKKFWRRISEAQIILVPTDDIVKIGKDPNTTARAPESWGHGSDKHFAAIDSIHQIHCLDSIRQHIYFDDYFSLTGENGKSIPAPGHMKHINHCIHSLLGNLMCSSNVNLITFEWEEGEPHPVGDFVVNKQCRDFEEVLKYQAHHKVDKETYMALRPEKADGNLR